MFSIATVQDLDDYGLVLAAFNGLSQRDGLRQHRWARFPVHALTAAQLVALGEVEFVERRSDDSASALVRPEPEMLIYISAGHGYASLAVAGKDRGAVDRVADEIVESLRYREPDDGLVPITFWAFSPGAPLSPRRRIAAPKWAELRTNYPRLAREALDGLMSATEPGPGGLVLWHGEPGTGKSYALRALAGEWRGWCETHFITDADAFLGSHSDYLMDVLVRRLSAEQHWRLIVLEDAGELLAADARAVAGQGLSRLLNLTDGLLGVGMRTLVLVTTNEPLRRLHPAVVRPGRAWAEVKFGRLDPAEANAWLAERGSTATVDRPASLAELFALAGGREFAERRDIGFAA